MENIKSRFALYFGNRGFFPASLIAGARQELAEVLKSMGHEVLILDADATRSGAVETAREGEVYANFLRANQGKFDGVILSLPNFGDETGAVAALQDAGVPIFIQAYPDELDKMAPESRRDAFCGKISIMDVFKQYQIKFTALKPHTVSPASDHFKANMDHFDRLCRVVKGMRRMVVGAIGARTTPFKTVRVDEVALQRHGITVETLDFSEIIARVRDLSTRSEAYQAKARILQEYAPCEGIPEPAFKNLCRLGVVLDQVIDEYQMDAVAVRCWIELQKQLGISVCVLMGEMNNRGIPAACEVDVANAVSMQALRLASGSPAALLDWNNNYGDEDDRCILFHCGPVPASLMTDRGRVTDHSILANSVGLGCSFGCHQGRIAPTEITFSGLLTDAGRLRLYLGEGRITADPIPPEFFGCAGVAEILHLQDVLLHIGRHGYRHHVSITPGSVQAPLREALESYLGYEVTLPQMEN
jgi:L-fucose isomerase-like protein